MPRIGGSIYEVAHKKATLFFEAAGIISCCDPLSEISSPQGFPPRRRTERALHLIVIGRFRQLNGARQAPPRGDAVYGSTNRSSNSPVGPVAAFRLSPPG